MGKNPINTLDDTVKKGSFITKHEEFITKYEKPIVLYCAILAIILAVLTLITPYDETDRENINDTTEQNPMAVAMNKAIDEARQLQLDGKNKKAIKKWQAIAEIAEGTDRDLATIAFFAIGNLRLLEGAFDEAIAAYERVLALNANFAAAHINLGKAWNALGEHQKALTACIEGIALKSDSVEVHLAEAYLVQGNAFKGLHYYIAAINDYTRVLKQKPDHAEAYNNRGNAYYHKGDFDSAIKDCTKAIDRDPDLGNAYYNRGVVRLCLREWEKAKTDLTDAKTMGINLAASFHNDYEGVANFEEKHGVKVPKDLAVLLRRD